LTVEELAKAKGLPVNFLQSLGCRTTSYCDNSAVLIPYHDEAGKVVAVRYRLSLNNADRFRWRRGDHATLYGLDRLADIRKHGWVLLVEGETDSWTCWLKDQPALGMPGKETWKPEWARLIRGVQPYLWVEPGADSIIERVAMDLPGLLVIPAPKD
jgi:hypothetical protein